jgi:protoporphyrinogen oxidase
LIGNEFEDCSLYHNYYAEATYEDFSHSEFFVQDSRGFSVILNGMVKEIGEENIKLKTKVETIEYSEEGCKVRTNNGNYDSDCIILTVSIGVLNSK